MIRTMLTKFVRRDDGSLSIEAAIILPILFIAFMSVFSIFEAFRAYSVSQKAAYTIGDSVSRETAPLDDDYMTGMLEMFEYLANSTGDAAIRISSLYYDADTEEYSSDWSQVKGSKSALTSEDVADWADKLPILPDQERIMLVETWNEFVPPFKTGLEQTEIVNFVFTRPRFAPRVCWENCN